MKHFHVAYDRTFTLLSASSLSLLTADCYAVAASEEVVYVWQFRNSFTRQLASETVTAAGPTTATNPTSAATKLQREGREKMFHIDNPAEPQPPEQFKAQQTGTSADPICCITAHQHLLLVARTSGVVHGFGLPGLNQDGQYLLRCRPQHLALNCDGSKLAVIDFNGLFSFMDMTAAGAGKMKGEHLAYERKVGCRISLIVAKYLLLQPLQKILMLWSLASACSVCCWHGHAKQHTTLRQLLVWSLRCLDDSVTEQNLLQYCMLRWGHFHIDCFCQV